MIKPFQILETRQEQDGTTGVLFSVSRTDSINANTSGTQTMTAYMTIPDGCNVDEYLFQELSKQGWF
jgi:hypothetical protein